MAINGSDWQIAYLGWSGFHLQRPAGPHIFIDPPKATIFPGNSAVIVFITHGHPEHLGGVMDLVAGENSGQGVTIIASKTVCNYLEDRHRPDNVAFIAVSPGQKQTLTAGIGFEVFQWRHMPLLPPGLWPAVRHIVSMIRKFRAAARIIKMSLNGPKGPGRMLGYRVRLSSDVTIVIYGEGLHRRCNVDDVAACAGATLLVASEPEDFAELPRLIAASGADEAILYEPHRQWRDLFSLPHIDLKALQKAIEDTGISAKIAKVETEG